MPFKKGKSGNPGGLPKERRVRNKLVAERARELIEKYELWEKVATLATSAEKDSDRMNAIKEIFNRAYGQAPKEVKLSASEGSAPVLNVTFTRNQSAPAPNAGSSVIDESD